jgi:murein DD-endopeptidase MepM/ murein hydrolase activator NlpD
MSSWLSLIACGLLAVGTYEAPDAIQVRVVPDPAYVERDAGGQYLNWDFRISNNTGDRAVLTRFEMSVLDKAGRLVSRRFLSAEGAIRPGIETVARREIEAGAESDLFNPFHTIDPALPVETLRFSFQFQAGPQQYANEVVVRPTTYRPLSELILPLKYRFIVYDGHDYYSHHRRLDLSDPRIKRVGLTESPIRYAYDFSTVDDTGALHRGNPSNHEEWFAYGTPVHAPGPGRVVSSANDVADNRLDNGRLIPAAAADPIRAILGNHVVIDHQNGEFSFLAHLKVGTVTVKPGDVVARDQLLGQIGFSGDTGTHVHLHYHIAGGVDMGGSQGRPLYFQSHRRLIGTSVIDVREGLLHTGDIVQRAER